MNMNLSSIFIVAVFVFFFSSVCLADDEDDNDDDERGMCEVSLCITIIILYTLYSLLPCEQVIDTE